MCHYEESLVQNTTTKIFQAHGKAELIEVWVMTSMEQKVNCFSKTCFPHLLSEKCSALSLSETDTIFNTFSGFKSIIPVLIKQDHCKKKKTKKKLKKKKNAEILFSDSILSPDLFWILKYWYWYTFVAHLCLTLCDPMNCSPPGSSVHGILQAKILEWVASPFSKGWSRPRDRTRVSCITEGFFTTEPPGKPH